MHVDANPLILIDKRHMSSSGRQLVGVAMGEVSGGIRSMIKRRRIPTSSGIPDHEATSPLHPVPGLHIDQLHSIPLTIQSQHSHRVYD